MKIISKLLDNAEIVIENKKYKIKIPYIFDWNKEKSILYMEYRDGKNLEFYLRHYETHLEGTIIINSILEFLIKNKVFWSDFAPRNIIVCEDSIYLVDFEKGIMNKNTNLVDFFRNHVYEEYCLFLLKEERLETFVRIYLILMMKKMKLCL